MRNEAVGDGMKINIKWVAIGTVVIMVPVSIGVILGVMTGEIKNGFG